MPVIDGLVTGIDSEAIIEGLLKIQQQQIDRLTLRREDEKSKQSALKSLQAQMAIFRTDAARLSRSSGNPLSARQTTVSNESALIATAASKAAIGNYDLTINSLARSHQVASQSFSDADAEISQGSLTLRSGSQPPVTLTIDASNNTLQGLADSINGANAGVSASIVQAGTGSFRLLLTSQESGAESAISLENNLAASSGTVIQPQWDFDNPVQEALDASVTLGTGAGAITVQSAKNEVTGLIEGVTLNLLQADPAQTVNLRVERNVESAQTAVQDFVDSFNSVMDFIDAQSEYNAESDEAGLLQGNRAVLEVQQRMRNLALDAVPGANPRMNRLSALGISVSDQGKLVVNSTRLNDVLSGRVEGVSEADVRRLFSLDGESTNRGIGFMLGTGRTQASTEPYEVDITQAAERASLTAATPLAATTTIGAGNNALELTVDSAAISITLNQGDFTADELASQLETLIKAHPEMQGRSVRVGVDGGGQLTMTSEAYGAASNLTITGGTALSDLGLTAGQSDIGVDVAGRFLVNGVVETAVGRGRVLTGDSENEHTADLQLQITLSPSQVTAGVEGEISITRGVAARMDQALQQLLDADSGKLTAEDGRFTETIESIQSSIDRQQEVFDLQQERLIEQFVALERAMSEMQSTSSFLAGQLASLNSLTTSRK